MPAIKIEKQDRRPPVEVVLKLSAGMAARLKAYATSLESDESYVAEQIFKETLPVEKEPAKAVDKMAAKNAPTGKVA